VTDLVIRELVDRVAILSLNRPDRHNAFNDAMIDSFADAIGWAITEPDARAILLRGEGRSFSSGRDVTELGTRAKGETDYEFVARAQQMALRLGGAPKPVVAALKGAVIGGALELALHADMRIAATDAVLRFPEITFGILPDTGGTQLLTMLAGPSRAKYAIMTGDGITAERALEWNVVDWVVDADKLDDRAKELAARLAAAPPLAIAMAKQLVDQFAADQIQRGVRGELLAQTALFASEDYAEARAAFREKRSPRFTGR